MLVLKNILGGPLKITSEKKIEAKKGLKRCLGWDSRGGGGFVGMGVGGMGVAREKENHDSCPQEAPFPLKAVPKGCNPPLLASGHM